MTVEWSERVRLKNMILGLLKIGEHQAASGDLWAFEICSRMGWIASSGYLLEGTEVFHNEIFPDSLITF